MKSLFFHCIFLFLSLSQKTHSQNLPKEWVLLFDCLHTHQKKITPDLFNQLNSKLSTFNSSLNFIPPERVAPLLKSLLYRYLLEQPPYALPKNLRSIVFIEKFFADYEKKFKNQSCSFTNWIIESMQSDFNNVQQNGGFLENISNNKASSLKAKGVTIQQYISQWIDFLPTTLVKNEVELINYYALIVLETERSLKTYSFFTPPQPTTMNYINWTFDSTFSSSKPLLNPEENAGENSAAEILERNLPKPVENPSTSKEQAIDELIKKKTKNLKQIDIKDEAIKEEL